MDLFKYFKKNFNANPTYKVSSGGRVEIIGNHTDHNHGLCCAATCNLTIDGFLKPRDDMNVNLISLGFGKINISLNDLKQKDDEKGSSEGLIRGVARYLSNEKLIIGGFDLVISSSIFPGAGVSSSAAFELLIGQIFNVIYNNGKINRLVLAKAGQYAENNDFGKKSGLLDQIGTGFGNISYIDFKDIENPKVEQIVYPFEDLHFVIVNTGGSHAHLSNLYSSIPEDMWNAAKKLGVKYLRDAKKKDSKDLTEMERNRAKHFFEENERVIAFKKAIERKDKQAFLDCINGSRLSSTNYLKNMMVENNYKGSPLEACDKAMKILGKEGACRINGGGFAGSIICIVPTDLLKKFKCKMSIKYGCKNVREIFVNPNGPIVEKI